MSVRYFEDLELDETHSFGPRTVTRDEIVSFAGQFDPQRMHIDEGAASDTRFGTLIASGWHTGSISMGLVADGLYTDLAVVGALGVDDLRWTHPVRPEDELSLTVSVAKKTDWDTETGLIHFDIETKNQNNETVMTRTDLVLVERVTV